MSQSSLNLGLKVYLLISSIVGIKCSHITKKNLLWINIFQSLYNNCILIIQVAFVPVYALQVLVFEIYFYQLTSSNVLNNGINNTIIIMSRFIWVASTTFTTIYTRIYWKQLVKSVRRLSIFTKTPGEKQNENHFTFFLCLGLNTFYLTTFLWSCKFNKTNPKILFWVRLAYLFYGHYFPITFCNLYFCVVEQLVLIAKELSKEAYLWENRRLALSSSKTSHSKFRKESKGSDIENFKRKLYALFDITVETLNYFQIPVSLIFLTNLFYVVSEMTRITTASSYEMFVLLPLIVNVLQISVILYFGDPVYQKTVALANFLYKMAADEESDHKKIQIYGICKVLERFPKISFFGFFTIGRHCLLPILSSFITYLIVGFQFSLSNTGGGSCTCSNS